MNSKVVIVAAASILAAACGNESFAPPPPGKEQIGVIGGKDDLPARYYLMEQERMPNGRLHAIVLQQFKNGRPGFPIGYQIDCNGPRWFNNGGDTLAALRAAPATDDRLTLGDPGNESAQIARWLCDK